MKWAFVRYSVHVRLCSCASSVLVCSFHMHEYSSWNWMHFANCFRRHSIRHLFCILIQLPHEYSRVDIGICIYAFSMEQKSFKNMSPVFGQRQVPILPATVHLALRNRWVVPCRRVLSLAKEHTGAEKYDLFPAFPYIWNYYLLSFFSIIFLTYHTLVLIPLFRPRSSSIYICSCRSLHIADSLLWASCVLCVRARTFNAASGHGMARWSFSRWTVGWLALVGSVPSEIWNINIRSGEKKLEERKNMSENMWNRYQNDEADKCGERERIWKHETIRISIYVLSLLMPCGVAVNACMCASALWTIQPWTQTTVAYCLQQDCRSYKHYYNIANTFQIGQYVWMRASVNQPNGCVLESEFIFLHFDIMPDDGRIHELEHGSSVDSAGATTTAAVATVATCRAIDIATRVHGRQASMAHILVCNMELEFLPLNQSIHIASPDTPNMSRIGAEACVVKYGIFNIIYVVKCYEFLIIIIFAEM